MSGEAMYWVASTPFTFGGVSFRKDQPVPCHRKPFDTLLGFGGLYVRPVFSVVDVEPDLFEEET